MSATEHITFCRICEAHCGMVATVEDGRVTKLRPDPDHPLSAGYACPKGIAMVDVQNDPDRVLGPLRRVGGPDEFEELSWEEAFDDISTRLRSVLDEHGPSAFGFYLGNPSAFSYSHTLWANGWPTPPAGSTRTCWPARSPRTSSRWPACPSSTASRCASSRSPRRRPRRPSASWPGPSRATSR